MVCLTNRHRHFAGVPEFKESVRIAAELGGHVIVGNMTELLVATAPELIPAAMAEVEKAGGIIIDAKTGHAVTQAWNKKVRSAVVTTAAARRLPILRGLQLSEPRKAKSTSNQPSASRGAALAADKFARLVRPEVERVKAELPASTQLTPTLLAKALNAQLVATARGGKWTGPSAKNLLARLDRLSPGQPTGVPSDD